MSVCFTVASGVLRIHSYKTLNAKGTKTVWVKCGGASKERATVILFGISDGGAFFPLVVFKSPPSTKQETKAENIALRYGFDKRVWNAIKQRRGSTGLQICGNAKDKLRCCGAAFNISMDRFLSRHCICLLIPRLVEFGALCGVPKISFC